MTKLVKLTDNITVNPDHVASVVWDRGHSYTALIIRLSDGTTHSIKHDYQVGWGGNDCYAIERKLLDA